MFFFLGWGIGRKSPHFVQGYSTKRKLHDAKNTARKIPHMDPSVVTQNARNFRTGAAHFQLQASLFLSYVFCICRFYRRWNDHIYANWFLCDDETRLFTCYSARARTMLVETLNNSPDSAKFQVETYYIHIFINEYPDFQISTISRERWKFYSDWEYD